MTVAWRRLPPSHSPLHARALRVASRTLVTGADPRPALAARLRAGYRATSAVLTDSGTSALQLAIRSVHADREGSASVALPAYACYDIATAAVASQAPLALYDIDPRTLGPEPRSLARCLSEGAQTIVVASSYGVPVDWNMVMETAAPWDAQVIEDAAQGSGATWMGRPLGTLADVSVLSFGRGKGWTGGSGGAMLDRRSPPAFADDALQQRPPLLQEVRGLLATLAQWLLARPTVYALPAALPGLHLGMTRYRAPEAARPMRRSAAALILETWDDALIEAGGRRAAGERLRRALAALPGVVPISAPIGGVAGDLRLPVLLAKGAAGLIRTRRAARCGLGPAYPGALADLSAVRARLAPWCLDLRWPGAEELVRQLVTAPTHSLTTDQDRDAILEAFADYVVPERASKRS